MAANLARSSISHPFIFHLARRSPALLPAGKHAGHDPFASRGTHPVHPVSNERHDAFFFSHSFVCFDFFRRKSEAFKERDVFFARLTLFFLHPFSPKALFFLFFFFFFFSFPFFFSTRPRKEASHVLVEHSTAHAAPSGPLAFFCGPGLISLPFRVDDRRLVAFFFSLLLLLHRLAQFDMPPKDKQKKAQDAAKAKAKVKVRVWSSVEGALSFGNTESRRSIDCSTRALTREKTHPCLVLSLPLPLRTTNTRRSRTRPLASRTKTSRARSRGESSCATFAFVFLLRFRSTSFDVSFSPFSSTFPPSLYKKKKKKISPSYVQQLQKSAQTGPKAGPTAEELRKQKKKLEEEQARELASLFACVAIKQPKLQPGVDPKSVVCEFFRAGQCAKGFKCKYSHDLAVERKTRKIDLFSDMRGGADGEEEEGMEDWDQGETGEFSPPPLLFSSFLSFCVSPPLRAPSSFVAAPLLSDPLLPVPSKPLSHTRTHTEKHPKLSPRKKKRKRKRKKQRSSSLSSSRSTAPTRETPRPPRPTTAPTSSASTSWRRSRRGSTAGSGSAPTGTRSANTGKLFLIFFKTFFCFL